MIQRSSIKQPVVAALLLATMVFVVGLVMLNKKEADLIGSTKVKYVFADSKEERIKGLSGRQSLGANEAMLFIFSDSNYHGIWMKDMNFPLDILWLNNNKEIVHIEEGVSPDSYPETFLPDTPAKYVIEVNAGFVDSNDISLGDSASF